MMKIILVALPTAVLAFSAGIWTEATMAGNRRQISAAGTPSTISPAEMQRNLKPDDLPVQFMKGDYN